MSQSEIQEKISAARREADGLKDKIRAAKDQTADTSRELSSTSSFRHSKCTPWSGFLSSRSMIEGEAWYSY